MCAIKLVGEILTCPLDLCRCSFTDVYASSIIKRLVINLATRVVTSVEGMCTLVLLSNTSAM